MLKFIKHNMETIGGVEIFPIISLLIFFTFFVGLFFWVFTYKKETIEELSNMPFMDNEEQNVDSNSEKL
ncbi:CcoQ/FixQ family Cbb3-type cytochrome c oxidase assembly chaperone [Myroides marinus]|uniref:Cbb3-type cytochrome oxidase component FixQ n=1 Tax=Myroides marinus TaxID=703342 RepID=A0A163WMW9_9FLAO|nr:CcoQ/FixQ family Cbb3-type cytochrome c oxidase assembly chaperone [Myroides marinus]MDR0194620.1 CcoQ/FixQ family Cbb3-type cytochrome c oxidase assembly chaperone [Myroides sp.]KUF39377.1 cytochrome C oxidase subunit IV [Myroides marinus]KZE76567.1 cytochrome C oxidase subunit IV [Myroides marinus]MDM1345815.1 CcoQ/FixQ family Cbb3-type cytochrome c oxidase assembly chaperone [Myroides marinus]MDM1349324.1 CcoQ/FixQ family Cbb3-type cytochrome c oxidase assembly chaperone [Myroides marinu